MKEKNKKNLGKILNKIKKDYNLKNPDFQVFLMFMKSKGRKHLFGVAIHAANEYVI